MTDWPPTLDQLKVEVGADDQRDDLALQAQLDAAMSFVRRVHDGRYEFDLIFGVSGLPYPGAEIVLGTLRLAARWYARRRSPDGLVAMGDLGSTLIPGFDTDLERMLEIGRYGGSVIA